MGKGREGGAASQMGTSALRRSGPARWFTRREEAAVVGKCRGSAEVARGSGAGGIRSGVGRGARTHVPVDVALVQPEPLREHQRHGQYRRTRQVGLSMNGEADDVFRATVAVVMMAVVAVVALTTAGGARRGGHGPDGRGPSESPASLRRPVPPSATTRWAGFLEKSMSRPNAQSRPVSMRAMARPAQM